MKAPTKKPRKLPTYKEEVDKLLAGTVGVVGRPTKYNEELAGRILGRISNGESLRTICKDDDMPDRASVFTWVFTYDDFSAKYNAARAIQAEVHVDEMINIADDTSNDTIDTETGTRANSEWIARSKLRIETRRWIAEKLKPKKYGTKIEIAGDPDAPIKLQTTLDVSNLTLEELNALEKALGKTHDPNLRDS